MNQNIYHIARATPAFVTGLKAFYCLCFTCVRSLTARRKTPQLSYRIVKQFATHKKRNICKVVLQYFKIVLSNK